MNRSIPYLNGRYGRRDSFPIFIVHDALNDCVAEPADDPGQHVDVAVGADDVKQVVANVVRQVPDQGWVQALQGTTLKWMG